MGRAAKFNRIALCSHRDIRQSSHAACSSSIQKSGEIGQANTDASLLDHQNKGVGRIERGIASFRVRTICP